MMQALIVDSNLFGENLPRDVKEAVEGRRVRIVDAPNTQISADLKNSNHRRYQEYKRQSFMVEACGDSVNRKIISIKRTDLLRSNDPHFVALAIITQANILVSNDRNLGADFNDWKRIDRDSGCIAVQRPLTKREKHIIRTNGERPTKIRDIKRFLTIAKIKSDCCECQINGGGC